MKSPKRIFRAGEPIKEGDMVYYDQKKRKVFKAKYKPTKDDLLPALIRLVESYRTNVDSFYVDDDALTFAEEVIENVR